MLVNQLLNLAYSRALPLPLNRDSKYILFSDLHKGDNSYADDFAQNMLIYKEALHHYYVNGYTYLELGDGLELWENRKIQPIIKAHQVIFDMLKDFNELDRLYLLYGNHDMVLMYPPIAKMMLGKVLGKVKYYESILLQTDQKEQNILLLHGHQADLINYLFWWFNQFMVRYVWKNLQKLGIDDPTSPAKNFKELIKVEKRMKNWIVQNNYQPVIFGHTHRPRFPFVKNEINTKRVVPMFNTGSCVHPDAIIGIEFKNYQIALVKWFIQDQKVVSEYLEGPIPVELLWSKSNDETNPPA